MGLFSNNKKLCPICGSPTPRLLPTKVANMPLCKECAGKVDLPGGALDQMSLEDFQKYLAFYEANRPLREKFTETYRLNFGFFGADLVLDTAHRLLRLKNQDHALVMEPEHIQSFRVLADERPLFEIRDGVLLCRRTDVEARARALAPQIDRFLMQQQEYDRMEQFEMLRQQMERKPGEKAPERPHISRPRFSATAPVQQFRVELTLRHPYWKRFEATLGAPDFDSEHPSVEGYLCDYNEKVNQLHELASKVLLIVDPRGREQQEGAAQPAAVSAPQPVQAAAADPVAEIQKYKSLLDAGVITEEEFTAKKRQLMGI